ncbi:MAG TPA: hypothetical protein VIJ88_02340, partial [Candidatus Paceibacterota bacterium]
MKKTLYVVLSATVFLFVTVPHAQAAVFTFGPSQTDESYFCADGFASCFAGGDVQTYNLGQGSGLQGGALTSVTIALDPTYASFVPANPWKITINCFTD